MRNLKPLSLFVFFFALARERSFIKTYSIESRSLTGTENILFAGASAHLSAHKFYRLGQWRGLTDWLMIDDHLFSALLSRLTALACGSTRVTSFFFYSAFFFFFFFISTEVVYLQRWHGWCHMKLQPSRRKFCVHHTTMHHVSSCKAATHCSN